jgi:hypothetical protein
LDGCRDSGCTSWGLVFCTLLRFVARSISEIGFKPTCSTPWFPYNSSLWTANVHPPNWKESRPMRIYLLFPCTVCWWRVPVGYTLESQPYWAAGHSWFSQRTRNPTWMINTCHGLPQALSCKFGLIPIKCSLTSGLDAHIRACAVQPKLRLAAPWSKQLFFPRYISCAWWVDTSQDLPHGPWWESLCRFTGTPHAL